MSIKDGLEATFAAEITLELRPNASWERARREGMLLAVAEWVPVRIVSGGRAQVIDPMRMRETIFAADGTNGPAREEAEDDD